MNYLLIFRFETRNYFFKNYENFKINPHPIIINYYFLFIKTKIYLKKK